MTRKEALVELIAKVESGDNAGFRRANRAVFSTPCQDMALQLREEYARHAFKGSLDDAKALHEAVLPGWEWTVGPDGTAVYLALDGNIYSANDACPARAWLLAILHALIARENAE